MQSKPSILIIYTGGTIGMIKNKETGALEPFDFNNLYEQIPALALFNYKIDHYCFDPILDSSNMLPSSWVMLAEVIEKHYEEYDGFVVLHGTDTMSYTASALSFILENLNKPVILTGSQLPLGVIRTDGRENFITSIEIAAAKEDETPVVPEVCVYFENQLFRGNRTHKSNADMFEAFKSPNYPALAEVGIYIKYNYNAIHKPNFKKLRIHRKMDTNIGIIKLFPGINKNIVDATLQTKGLKAIILETYGSGNAPTCEWFISSLKNAIDKGIIVLNVTQCESGAVEIGKYQTSEILGEIGVISAKDMTTEAALAKLMFLLGNTGSGSDCIESLYRSVSGEMTI